MAVTSRAMSQISWRERREVANLMAVLTVEQTRVAERLVRLREAHALTQEVAAARAGVTLRQWQRWESGESEPYARNIAKISEEFEIPLHELVGSEPTPEPSQLDRIEKQLDANADAIKALAEQMREMRADQMTRAGVVLTRIGEAEQAIRRSLSPPRQAKRA